MLVEPNAEGMHQKRTQNAIAQMPQVACPNAFELAAIGELPKNGINPIANLPQNRALISWSLGRMRFAERGLQDNPIFAQARLHIRQPIVAITQHQARSAFQHHRSHFPIGFIGRSQEDMGDDARPAQTQVQAKAVKGLPIGMIFAPRWLGPENAHTREHGQSGKREAACYR